MAKDVDIYNLTLEPLGHLSYLVCQAFEFLLGLQMQLIQILKIPSAHELRQLRAEKGEEREGKRDREEGRQCEARGVVEEGRARRMRETEKAKEGKCQEDTARAHATTRCPSYQISI